MTLTDLANQITMANGESNVFRAGVFAGLVARVIPAKDVSDAMRGDADTKYGAGFRVGYAS